MTIHEYKKTLNKLTLTELTEFNEKLGGKSKIIDDRINEFVENPKLERKICSILNLKTEEEKINFATIRSSYVIIISVTITFFALFIAIHSNNLVQKQIKIIEKEENIEMIAQKIEFKDLLREMNDKLYERVIIDTLSSKEAGHRISQLSKNRIDQKKWAEEFNLLMLKGDKNKYMISNYDALRKWEEMKSTIQIIISFTDILIDDENAFGKAWSFGSFSGKISILHIEIWILLGFNE